MIRRIDLCNLPELIPSLHAGDSVLLSGCVYTARDAAHKRIAAALDAGVPLPFPLRGAVIYYAGPTSAPEGRVIGSCGPTTSGRMDVYTPRLLSGGLAGMIGKGERSPGVVEAIRKNRAVYFCAIGGAGALAAERIVENTVIAYEDLGCESVKQLKLLDFPVVVAVDSEGNDLFKTGRSQYAVV